MLKGRYIEKMNRTTEEIKEWLKRGFNLDNEIKQLTESAQKAYDNATSISQKIDFDRVQTSKINGSEHKFLQVVHYAMETTKKVSELYAVKTEILEVVYMVNNPIYRTLLLARYINFKTWEQIAMDMNYDVSWIHRLHDKALETIKETIENHYNPMI